MWSEEQSRVIDKLQQTDHAVLCPTDAVIMTVIHPGLFMCEKCGYRSSKISQSKVLLAFFLFGD